MRYALMRRLILIMIAFSFNLNALSAEEITPEEVREYVKKTFDILDGTNELLDQALLHNPIGAYTSTFLDVFKIMMKADEMYSSVVTNNWQQAVATAAESGIDYVLATTWIGSEYSSLTKITQLGAVLIEISIDAFLDTAITVALNNQIKLYNYARSLGYTHQQIMDRVNSDDILFTDDGWLYIVGDMRIPAYGGVRPGDLTREQVYGYASEKAYPAYDASAYYLMNKETIGEEFKKIIQPEINYTLSNSAAPANVTFSVSGSLLGEMNIISYEWKFGDSETGTGPSISHYYKQPGSYNVNLILTDSTLNTHSYSTTVVVKPPPIYISYPNGYEDLYRQYETPEISGVQSYVWDFGDGVVQTDDKNNATHTYTNSGLYIVQLTLVFDDNSAVEAKAYIFVGPGTRYINGHTIYDDETWHSGGTYVVLGSITVAQGARLTIEPGTVVKLNSSVQFFVYGTLTATDATFTWADGQNQWGGIKFEGEGANNSRLENCLLEHAIGTTYYTSGIIDIRNSSPTITGCTIGNSVATYGIYINGGSPVISFNTITGMKYGLYIINTSSPTVTGNTVSDNQYGFYIIAQSSGTYQANTISGNEYGICASYGTNNPVIIGNTYSDNSTADLSVSGNINTEVVWGDGGDSVFHASSLTISAGGSLTIKSGQTVKLYEGSNIYAYGTLIATGVTFTWADGQNQWGGIKFEGEGANNSRLENCLLEHAIGTTYYTSGIIDIRNSSPTITGCTIGNSVATYGIYINGGSPVISFNTITGMKYGLYIINTSSPTVTGNTVSDNQYGILISNQSAGVYQTNTITGNAMYGLYYSGSSIINATDCNWGDVTGPLDSSDDRASGGWYNPSGLGNKVSDHVNYTPWVNPEDDDNDGLPNDSEYSGCTKPDDADTDDDGIKDGDEDKNHNGIVDVGETNPCKPDSDNDGIQDGTELGVTSPVPDSDGNTGPIKGTDENIFIPDADPSTTTDPLNDDTNSDGNNDGDEDKNHNGKIDDGETDPATAGFNNTPIFFPVRTTDGKIAIIMID